MELLVFILFGVVCLYACTRPPVALALVIVLFPAEIVLQALSPTLRSAGFGSKAVNVSVGAVALLAVLGAIARDPERLGRLIRPVSVTVFALFGWSAITLLWSPGGEAGLESVLAGLPYFAVILVLAPLLVRGVDEFGTTVATLLVLVCGLCIVVLASPEFVVKDSRLGFDFGAATRSNPLALGEMGGLGIIVGLLARNSLLGAWAVPVRLAAVFAGSAIAIQSGSRGQFFYALAVALVLLPIAAPMRNVRTFIMTTGSAIFAAAVAYILLGSLLLGAAEKRFTLEGLLYGSSSSETRVTNVAALASAWVDRPLNWIPGLGLYAFNGLFADSGNIYSHVLFADMIFEEGLPGVALMSGFLFLSFRACIRLFRGASSTLAPRSSAAVLIGLFAYQVLLVNKQGTLWGCQYFFLFGSMLVIFSRQLDDDAMPGADRQPEAPDR